MTDATIIIRYMSPMLLMAIAMVLFCVYLYIKKKRSSSNVSIPTTQDGNTALGFHTVAPPGGYAEEQQGCDRFPPRYSTVDHPPPYSLFDPKQTSMWPGVPPAASEMYPTPLPLASYSQTTPASNPSDNPTTIN